MSGAVPCVQRSRCAQAVKAKRLLAHPDKKGSHEEWLKLDASAWHTRDALSTLVEGVGRRPELGAPLGKGVGANMGVPVGSPGVAVGDGVGSGVGCGVGSGVGCGVGILTRHSDAPVTSL